MPPGDPSNFQAMETEDKKDEDADGYKSLISIDDWYVDEIMNFNEVLSNTAQVYAAVKVWKTIADNLRTHNYPLCEGISNTSNFDENLKKNARKLEDLLDLIITGHTIHDESFYQKMRILLAQGEQYSIFKEKMNNLDISTKCNKIWENDAVAYRCNTCALTPCMSLCESCFEQNGHKGHDFTRFLSREGGACDCGNEDVIKPGGFCNRHGNMIDKPPTNFLEVSLPEFIMVKLLVRLFLEWRGWWSRMSVQKRKHDESFPQPDGGSTFNLGLHCEEECRNVVKLIEFLQECVNYGGPMREAMTRILLDADLYKALTEKRGEHVNQDERIEVNLDWRTRHLFEDDRLSLMLPSDIAPLFPLIDTFEKLNCQTLLDELIFWIIRQNFPHSLINFSLSMLSEIDYRDAFARRFFTWYPLIGKVFQELCAYQAEHGRGGNIDRVQLTGSRVIHVSVQMLSSGMLCKKLNEECDLVNTVCNVTKFLLCEKMVPTDFTFDATQRFHMHVERLRKKWKGQWNVMQIDTNASIDQHGYWFVMGDMQNLLSHSDVVISAILNRRTFRETYIGLLARMQGMNQIWRIVIGVHQEMDTSDVVQRAYSLEYETLAVTLFNMISSIQFQNHTEAAIVFFDAVYDELKEWFNKLGIDENDETLRCQPYTVSFHIPLHRLISTALTHLHDIAGFRNHLTEKFLKDKRFIRYLIFHPLRIQVARAEIQAGMWMKNGQDAKMLSLIYTQNNVNNAFQTPDIDLIRYCAANSEKTWLIRTLVEAFYLDEKIIVKLNENKDETFRMELFGFSQHGEKKDFPEERIIEDSNLIEFIVENEKIPLPAGSLITEKRKLEILAMLEPRISHVTLGPRQAIRDNKLWSNEEEQRAVHQLLRNQLVNNLQNLEDNRQDPIDFIPILDRPGFSKEFMERIGADQNGPRLAVMLRPEWLDPLLQGMLRTIAELLVVRVNCGATSEEHFKSELIHSLSCVRMTHSKLRGSLCEKGSRATEAIDRVFDGILNEIADFIEPDANLSYGSMQQGVYRLKDSVWDKEFCPVFCLMRSNGHRNISDVFEVLAEKDHQFVKQHKLYDDIKTDPVFWIPFRLIDFSKNDRHAGISEIFSVLLTDQLLYTCCLAIFMHYENVISLHYTTVQLALYLLTLSVKYAQYQHDSTEDEHLQEYFKRFYHIPYKMKVRRDENYTCTIFSIISNIFEKECRKLECYETILEKVLDSKFDEEKVYGGSAIYLARFMSIIVKLSPVAKNIIRKKLIAEKMENERLKGLEEDMRNKQNSKKSAKEVAKLRMARIMEQSKRKNQETMQKMMEKEGMSKEQVAEMDTAQSTRLYDCPICGDIQVPNTIKAPLGMFVKVSSNFLAEEQIDANLADTLNICDVDENFESEEVEAQMKTRKSYMPVRRSFGHIRPEKMDMLNPASGIDLKTCGHTAHITCFKTYRQSVHDSHGRMFTETSEVGCPLCRFTVNSIVPVSIEHGFEIEHQTPLQSEEQVIHSIIQNIEMNRDIDQSEERKHINALLLDVVKARKRTSDSSEKKMYHEWETPSTSMISIAVANVERNSIMRKMNYEERRKNTSHLITEHLLSGSVLLSEPKDLETVMTVLNHFLGQNYKKKDSEKRERAGKSSLETLNVEGLDLDDVMVLTKRQRKSPELEQSISITTQFSSSPLLMYDPRSMFARCVSFIHESKLYSEADKKWICRALLGSFIDWVSLRGLIRLLLRLPSENITQIRNKTRKIEGLSEESQEKVDVILESLCSNESYFETLLKSMESDEPAKLITDSKFVTNHEKYLEDFIAFSNELLYHIGVCETIEVNYKYICEKSPIMKTNVQKWINDYKNDIIWSFNVVQQPLTTEPIIWKPRRILRLPQNYDDLFNRYFHRECLTCCKVPAYPLICLMCSKLICLGDCCQTLKSLGIGAETMITVTEMQAHAEECSSSSGIFLSLTSSLIIIGRGNAGAIWGSVYLDSHGEEDRNLKRGKPLTLSDRRFELLERDWHQQEWQRIRHWYPFSTPLVLISCIRDAHYLVNM